MNNRSVLFFGIVLIVIGVISILSNLFGFDFWTIFWPLVLIGLGVWFLFRPKFVSAGASHSFLFIGDIQRNGAWKVSAEEFITFIGDIDLDFTQAQMGLGETIITCSGFIGDTKLIVPAGLGVKVTSAAFVSDVKFLGGKQTNFLNTLELASPGYETAERKVCLKARNFISDIKVTAG